MSTRRSAGCALLSLTTLTGCESALERDDYQTQILAIQSALDRELNAIPPVQATPKTQESLLGPVERALAPRRDQLEALGPLGPASPTIDYGTGLDGNAPTTLAVDLNTAVLSAARNNLSVQAARLDPAIGREETLAAEAVFDAVAYGSVDYQKLDEPQTVPTLNGILLSTPFRVAESSRFEAGVRKPLEWGGALSVSTDLTRSQNSSPGIALFPDPAYDSAVRVGLAQPLLRGFGTAVNSATIRLTRNLQRRNVLDLEQQLLDTVNQTERAYWQLALAERRLRIAQWLVHVGTEVRDILEKRQQFDATPAQFADAIARVEQRKADVIRAQRDVQAASDLLKTLINDDGLPVSGETIVTTVDRLTELPVEWNLSDAMVAATRHRPEIEKARLQIDDAAIRQMVADNARLPSAEVNAQLAFLGQDDNAGDAYGELGDNSFVDYLLGLRVEQAIGNRAAEADFRRARLERSRSIIGFRTEVQRVALEVKTSLRDVVTNFNLISATRSFRIAQAENLRALSVEEENLASLTPEFLNLKFTTQETLARAQLQEVQAIAEYNIAVAQLQRTMGTSLDTRGIAVDWGDPADAE